MRDTLVLIRGDIVYIFSKGKNNEYDMTDGGYAVVVSGTSKSKQKYIDVVWIDHSRRYTAAYPTIWHLGAEAVVPCRRGVRIDRRRVLYVDGRCSRKEMARIDAAIGGGYGKTI